MNNNPTHNNSEDDSQLETSCSHLELPKPDPENITVFTHNLPNQPILPWNRYDSPWEKAAEKEEMEEESVESATAETEPDSEENREQ